MADDVQDIYVSTDAGTEWQSLSALAAEQVQATLPISDEAGTVTVDGAASVFTVSTGGTPRLYVRADGNIGHGYAGQANVNFSSYMGFGLSTVEEFGFLAATKFDNQPSTSMVAFESQPEFGEGIKATNLAHFRANDERGTNKPLDVIQRGFYTKGLTLSTVGNRGFEANENMEAGKENYAFFAGGTAPSYFGGQIQTPSVRGPADNDASMDLGTNLTVSTGGEERLRITDNDIKAQTDYVPQTDDSLVTKGWVAANGASGELPISSEDASVTLQSPAEDEFEVELAGEMQLRITANDIQVSPGYQPQSDTSLVTKRFLYGQGNGNNPIVPPGQNSGASWQTIVVDQSEYQNAQVRLQNHVLACDGIFTIGPAWSVNGVDWFESGSGSGTWTEDGISTTNGHFICKGTLSGVNGQSMYMTGSGTYFSYNMKNWIAVPNAVSYTESNRSPVWYWNNDFFLNQYNTDVGIADDDSGRIPQIRSVSKQWQSGMRYDYSTGNWSITRKEAAIWFYGQTAPTPAMGYPDDDDIPFLKYLCSKSDGTTTIGVQPPFTYSVNSPDTASRLCYIKPNANQDVDSEDNAYQASWEVIPQFSSFDAGDIQGIAYDEEADRWVFITDRTAYSCQGNPATATWRSTILPTTANWSEGFHYNGIRFIAASEATNSNICVYSDDGLDWQFTSNIQTNSEYTACGTNGRSILSGISASLASQFTYAITPVHVDSINTSEVNLTEPVGTTASYTQRTGRATLLTQEDANEYFAGEIAKKASVVTLSQAEYDALTEVDEDTLYLITPL